MSGKFGGGGTPCTVCEKTVYPAEAVSYEKQIFHFDCFRCKLCTKKIEQASGASMYDSTLYCKQCFQKEGFAQKQRNVKWTPKESSGGVSSRFGGGGTPCTVCSKTVYPAEAVSFEKQTYHAECLKCNTCTKKLGAAGAAQYEDTIYCRLCFDKGGFAQKQRNVKWEKKESTGTTSRFGGGGNPCTVCAKTVYPAEAVSFEKKIYHQECLKCDTCSKKCAAANAACFEDTIYCRLCFDKGGFAQKQRKVQWTKKEGGPSSGIASKFGGGGSKCTTCDKTVYPAETVSFEKKPYHANCLSCHDCKKVCTVSNCNEFEGGLYCSLCFERGGYRQKQAKVKVDPNKTTTYDARFAKFGGGGAKCVKCNETVFSAEQVSYEKQAFHAKCFCCTHCSRELKITDAEHKGPDPYCKKCFYELGLNRAENN